MKKTGTLVLATLFCFLSASVLHAQTYRTAPATTPALEGFGGAVAVGPDAVFIGESQNTYHPGVVYVYTKDGTSWAEAAQLTASDAQNNDQFGSALAVDENRLLVGAPQSEDTPSRAYVFERDGASDEWTQVARMTSSVDTTSDGFGKTVALRGNWAVIGAPAQDSARGAAHVFRRSADGEWTRHSTLTGSAAQKEANFGASIALDGTRLLVGAPGQNNKTGSAYLFRYERGEGWTEEAQLASSSVEEENQLGASVHLKEDLALVGAPRYNDMTGTVFAYRPNDAGEWEETTRLQPFASTNRHLFGASIAQNGREVWIGAPGASSFRGRIHRFAYDAAADDWSGVQKLGKEDLESRSFFGGALALNENVAVVGITGADYGAGTASLFEWDGNSWQAQNTLRSERKGLQAVTGEEVECEDGDAEQFECSNVNLLSFLPIRDIGGGRGVNLNDIWGWTDPQTGTEYALVGRMDGTAFVDISDPTQPVYVGELPKTEGSQGSSWRDIKVYDDHAFIVSDNAGEHGMQVFDLTRLRDVDEGEQPVTFDEDAHYDGVHSAHNIVINEDTGFAYIVGAGGGGQTCGGGLHMVNIQDPLQPSFEGCFADERTGRRGTGYSHDAQCLVYQGPDEEHDGQEICFGSNETALSIADVTDKDNPEALAVAEYPNASYTHQGWITPDHRYFYVNDELDELSGNAEQTRTLIWDITDLDDPQLVKEYTYGTTASDHNMYVKDNLLYMSNYKSGLRVHDISDPTNPKEIGYFDTAPAGDDGPGFAGTWSNYPFFKSGVIAVSSIGEGLFLLKNQKQSL